MPSKFIKKKVQHLLLYRFPEMGHHQLNKIKHYDKGKAGSNKGNAWYLKVVTHCIPSSPETDEHSSLR